MDINFKDKYNKELVFIPVYNGYLNKNTKLDLSCMKIFGLNVYSCKKIMQKSGLSILNNNIKYKFLLKYYKFKFYNILINDLFLGFKLKLKIHDNIKNLINIRHYKGARHALKLPMRGQRTHNNRMTQRKIGAQRLFVKHYKN